MEINEKAFFAFRYAFERPTLVQTVDTNECNSSEYNFALQESIFIWENRLESRITTVQGNRPDRLFNQNV